MPVPRPANQVYVVIREDAQSYQGVENRLTPGDKVFVVSSYPVREMKRDLDIGYWDYLLVPACLQYQHPDILQYPMVVSLFATFGGPLNPAVRGIAGRWQVGDSKS